MSTPPVAYPFPDNLLPTLLGVSLTAVNLLRPLYGADGAEIVDFHLDYLNPAAQRMAGLPEQPGLTALARFPDLATNGVLDFYRRTFLSGAPGTFELNYQADGLDNYFRLAAQRCGEVLVVSFTDTGDEPRTPVENALRESQAREQAARADAEAQRQRFYEVLMALPAQVATYHGPDHVYTFVNAAYRRYFPARPLPGCSIREVVPEAEEQGVFALMDRVYRTGEPHYAHELEAWLDFAGSGERQQVFLNLCFYPLRSTQGRVDGLLDFSYDVSEQVRARRLVEELNQELETRVQARTQELRAVLQRTEQRREQLQDQQEVLRQILGQVPAAIATLAAPEHRFQFFNEAYQALVGGRAQVGRTAVELFPEVVPQGFIELLDQVYATGQPYRGTETPIEFFDAATGQHTLHFMDFIYQPLTDGLGQTTGILAFVVDVTERVRSRQQAADLQAELLAAARRQAQEREAFYQVFQQTPALVQLLRAPGHRVEYVNPAYQRLFPGRALLGRDLADALPELREQGFIALLDRVYETGETHFGIDTPFLVPAAEGQPARIAYYNFTYQAYRENGQVAGISLFAYDITGQVLARRRAEALQTELLAAARHQAQERATYQQVFEQTPAAICIQRGPEHRYEYVNDAYRAFFPGRPLLGQSVAEALPETVESGVVDLLDRVYRTGETYYGSELPLLIAQPQGPPKQMYFTFTYQAYHEDGQIVGISTFAYDVSEQVRARTQQQAHEQLLREIFAQAPVAIFVLRGPGYVLEIANAPMGELLGRAPTELLGRPYFEAVPELASQGYPELLAEVWRTGVPHVAQELEARFARHQAGDAGYFNFVYQPLRDEGGQITGILCVATDVSEQVRARRQVQRLNEELAAANQELSSSNQQLVRTNVDLDNFIYTASHDLKAPITNIEGLLDTLQHELPAPSPGGEVAYILGLMQDSVNRFKRTIEHLTDVSRLQKEHGAPSARIDLAPVIEDVRLDLAPLLQQTGGRLAVALADCPPVQFAEKNLRSVVYNLLSNALKYRHPDRRPDVRVRGHRDGAFVVLEVQDNGLGMDLSQGQEKLFALFQRLHTHVEGTGIGLYMVKRMVENAGGQITVHSQLGEGTTFTVCFPC